MDWGKVLNDVFSTALVAFLIIFVPLIGTLLGKLLVAFINSIKNPTIRHLAGDAVLWAEDKFGSKPGDTKLEFAIQFLMAKLKMSHDDAEKAVRAAYQNIFGQFPKAETPATPAA